MDTVLLIVSDNSLRRLYHELLLSINLEVIPTNSIENALTNLVLRTFSAVILYAEDKNMILVETFLHVRRKHKTLYNTRVIIITTNSAVYSSSLLETDISINPNLLTCAEIAITINNYLSKK